MVAVPPVQPVNVVAVVPVYVTIEPPMVMVPAVLNPIVEATLIVACGSVCPFDPMAMVVLGAIDCPIKTAEADCVGVSEFQTMGGVVVVP